MKPPCQSEPFRFRTHRLADLLDAEELRVIDARPRILPRPDEQLQPTLRLVDLEHAPNSGRLIVVAIAVGFVLLGLAILKALRLTRQQ